MRNNYHAQDKCLFDRQNAFHALSDININITNCIIILININYTDE